MDDANAYSNAGLRSGATGPKWSATLEHPDPGVHIAQVYRDDGFLAEAAGRFVAAGLRAGEGVLALCTLARWETVRRWLDANGVDATDAAARRQLLRTGVHSLLLDWMSNHCDPAAFNEAVHARVGLLLRHYPSVRVFSEAADVLLYKLDPAMAADVQRAWNGYLRGKPVAVLSPWRIESLDLASYRHGLESLYLIHDRVLPAA